MNIIQKFSQRLLQNRTVQQLSSNTAWIMVDKVVRLAIRFAVGIWVARYLGPAQFGDLNFAMALVGIFIPLTHMGLARLAVRDMAKNPEDRQNILGTVFALQTTGTMFMFVLAVTSAFFLSGNQETFQLAVIVALGNVFSIFISIEYWFESQISAKYITFAKLASLIIVPIFQIYLITSNSTLIWFALVPLIDISLAGFGLILVYRINVEKIRMWKIDYELMRIYLRDGFPLLLSAVSILIYLKIDQILLQIMVNATELGIYSSVVRLSEAWYFVPIAIMSSVLPKIVQARETGQNNYYNSLYKFSQFMWWLAISASLIISLFSNFIIESTYGNQYISGSPILVIHAWSGIAVAMGLAGSAWIIAENKTRISFQRTIIGAVLNIVLNLVLIPKYQGVGAAIATLISYTSATFVWLIILPESRSLVRLQFRALLFMGKSGKADKI